MLKHYLNSCSSREYIHRISCSRDKSKDNSKLYSINADNSIKTLDVQTNRQRFNVRQTNKNNYYTGMRGKQATQIANYFNNSKVLCQETKQIQQTSIERTTVDLEQTKKNEESQYQLRSQNRQHKQLKQVIIQDRGRSNEKIKVLDVFHSPSAKKSMTSQKLMIDLGCHQSKADKSEQKNNSQPQRQIQENPSTLNQKVPMTSRLDESRDILSKLNRKQSIQTNNQQNLPSQRKSRQSLKSFFLNNPQTQMNNNNNNNNNNNAAPYKLNGNFRNSSHKKSQILKFESEKGDKFKNENILELLLLSTGELKEKFQQESSRQYSSDRQQKTTIRVRAGTKFPQDFFE